MPGEFVALAEDTGLTVPIGRWGPARRLPGRPGLAAPLPPPAAAVPQRQPVVRQLQQPDLLEDVAGALDASGLDPDQLMLQHVDRRLIV
jgi:EAL domain-containing protein (putative c-di-GMP-specific phosphodiesterase class I)